MSVRFMNIQKIPSHTVVIEDEAVRSQVVTCVLSSTRV